MNISIDAATATIITAIIVGLISIITTIIANKNSLRQQQIQWEKEERKAEREERQIEKDRELALKNGLISELQEIYANSIASLTALLIFTDGNMRLRPEYEVNVKETQKWLSRLLAFHYDKASEEYATF